MANDADNVIIGQTGQVWVAPVGTAMPVDTTTAMGTVNAAWKDLGFLSEDGVTFTPSIDTFQVNAWQAQGRPVRRGVASRDESLSFTMLEWKLDTLKIAFGGGEITEIGTTDVYKYTPVTGAAEVETALVVDWLDNAIGFRLLVPRATVTDLAEFQLVRTDAAGLNVTLGVVNDGSVDPFSIISTKAEWAPA